MYGRAASCSAMFRGLPTWKEHNLKGRVLYRQYVQFNALVFLRHVIRRCGSGVHRRGKKALDAVTCNASCNAWIVGASTSWEPSSS